MKSFDQVCQESFERLDDYLDRELTAGELEMVRAHLLECERCAREFACEETWIRQVREKVRRIDVSPGLRARIRRAIDEAIAR